MSLKSAVRAVRRLRKQVAERDALINIFDSDRRLMAKLAADKPQFSNPLEVMEANKIRDLLLMKF